MGNGHDHDDATVVGAPDWPSTPSFVLRFDTGIELTVTGRTFVGRSPEPRPAHLGGAVVSIDDPTMQMSKTHALFDVVDGALRVSDVGSTNGTSVVDAHGEAMVPVGTWRVLRLGDRIRLGERWAEVLAPAGASRSPTRPAEAMPPAAAAPPPVGTPPPFAPPPTSAPPGSLPPAQPAAPTTQRTSRVPRAAWIALAAVAVIVVATSTWFLVLRNDEATNSGGASHPALATDPTLRFARELDMPEPDDVEITGSASSVYVLAYDETADETTIIALDGEGTVRWDVSFDGEFDDHQVVQGELVVAIEDGDDSTLRRLAEDDAAEVWSLAIGDAYWILGPEGVYVFDRDVASRNGAGEIELHDAATAESLGRARLADRSSVWFDYFYVQAFLSWDGDKDEIQVLSTRLEALTERIHVADADAAAYRDGVLLVGVDDELSAYGSSGERTLRSSSLVDEIGIIAPLGSGRWLVQGSSELEVVHLTGGGVEPVWRKEGRSANVFGVDGRHYIVLYDDDVARVLDAGTGHEVLELGEGSIDPAANGVLLHDAGMFNAYELPSGDLLWSIETPDEDDLHQLDGGHAIIVRDGDEISIEVYS